MGLSLAHGGGSSLMQILLKLRDVEQKESNYRSPSEGVRMVNRADFSLSSTAKENDLECKEPAKPRSSSLAGSKGF